MGLEEQVIQLPLCDRWLIYRRLEELMISCCCHSDGTLRVRVNNSLELILVRSTIMQFIASRSELIQWLERCWNS